MSYIPANKTENNILAQPVALTALTSVNSTTQSVSVGAKMTYATTLNWYGSYSPSHSAGDITLDSGYYYFCEASIQYAEDAYTPSDQIVYQIYDETNNNYLGTPSLLYSPFTPALNPTYIQTNTRDEACRALIDCSSSGVNISVKIKSFSGVSNFNYYPGLHSQWSGLGRIVIWRLST